MGVRKPIVAGQFYSENPEELKEQIKLAFESDRGPKELDPSERDVKGIIVPHAGYFFSGSCASHAYKLVSRPDLIIILGASHSGKTCFTSEDWETPLGIVETDKEFCSLLNKNGLEEDPANHSQEHSIETQLPFLQYMFSSVPKIVGINVGVEFEKVYDALVESLKGFDKKVLFIASSDFTHYGMSYRYVPFINDVKEEMYAMDKKAIEFICSLNVVEFNKYLREINSTICGAFAIMVLMKLMSSNGELLSYYTSADVYGEYDQAVGYGCIVFKN
jgi:MEMO1 family protein